MQNTTPDLIAIKGGLFPKYRLKKAYRYYFYYKEKTAAFDVPKDFEYDGASFGSFLFWRKSMHKSPHTLAHDWLYSRKGNVSAHVIDSEGRRKGKPFNLVKKEADTIWLEGARRDENIQNWRTYIASALFKTAGHLYWRY